MNNTHLKKYIIIEMSSAFGTLMMKILTCQFYYYFYILFMDPISSSRTHQQLSCVHVLNQVHCLNEVQ